MAAQMFPSRSGTAELIWNYLLMFLGLTPIHTTLARHVGLAPKVPRKVLSRLIAARQKLKSIVATVTTAESQGPLGEQWSGNAVCRHVDHHLQQIRDLSKASLEEES